MEGPAYPIIQRIRIPRGPHRLRDRRWPPVETPEIANQAPEPALPAGSPESTVPPGSRLWEEHIQNVSIVSATPVKHVQNTISQHSEQSPRDSDSPSLNA